MIKVIAACALLVGFTSLFATTDCFAADGLKDTRLRLIMAADEGAGSKGNVAVPLKAVEAGIAILQQGDIASANQQIGAELRQILERRVKSMNQSFKGLKVENGRLVVGVRSGSAADLAGFKVGDKITAMASSLTVGIENEHARPHETWSYKGESRSGEPFHREMDSMSYYSPVGAWGHTALWLARGKPLHAQTLLKMSEWPQPEIFTLNFEEKGPSEIAAWVKQRGGPENFTFTPSADCVAHITGAFEFGGRWQVPFDKATTYPGSFRGVPNKVYFMHSSIVPCNVVELPVCSVVLIPMEWDYAAFVLPKGNSSVEDVIRGLDGKGLEKLVAEVVTTPPTERDVALPKFAFSSNWKLSKYAANIGIDKLLGPTAPVRFFESEPSAYVSEIDVATEIKCDEQGFLAKGAASAAVVTFSGTDFKFDRPFLFLGIQGESRLIDVIGIVRSPEGIEAGVGR